MTVHPSIYHATNCSQVILVNDTTALPIYVSFTQADSIINGLHGHRYSRPFTHDLFMNIVNSLGASIKRVVIDNLFQGIFMAHLSLEYCKNGELKEITVDARPSDCIALAVREGCDIFVSEKILLEAGKTREEMGLESF